MRIGIEAYLWGEAGSYRQSGVSTYIRHLVRGLADIPLPEETLVYLPSPEPLADLPAGLHARVSPFPLRRPVLRIGWENSALPLLLLKDRVRLLHSTMNVAPWWVPCPFVVTVHDLAYLRYPRVHPRGRRAYLTLMTRWTARRVRAVIAVSAYTAQEVERLLGLPSERIVVIYEGVDADYQPRPRIEVESFRREHGLPEHYILYVGNLEPRKNLPRLIEAYARVRAPGVSLVLLGPRGWEYDEIFRRVEALNLSGRVIFPGFVPREELPLWYNGAMIMVYPSLYEGFGLPPLEAMACGTPVLVSSSSSLPEVVGTAGLQVAPDDTDALAAEMQHLLDDPALRSELSQRGMERARLFSWARMAQETADLYRRLLEERR